MSTASNAPLWRNPDLLKVLVGEAISDFGSQVGGLALPLLAALTLDATPAQMATLLALEYLPRIVVSLAAGGWIDRIRKRRLLIAANTLRAMLLALLALAAAVGSVRMETLYVVAPIMAGLDALFTASFVAYLPSLVSERSLVSANASRATTSAAADVAGPAAAGALISAFGAAFAIGLDAMSFLASVGGLLAVRAADHPVRMEHHRAHPLHEIVDGWRALLGNPVLRAFAATAFTANFFYRVIMSVYVLYLTRDLALSPATVGAIFGLGGGLGVLLGSATAAFASRTFGLGRTLVGAHLLFGVLGLPLALSTLEPSRGVLLVFVSEFAQLAVNAVYMVNRTSVEQVAVPAAVRGRVQAARTVAHAVAGALGLLVGGIVGERFGPSAAIVLGVVGGLTSFLWLSASPIGALRDLSDCTPRARSPVGS
jgi:predicted MFS family arabinose efflux permease